MGKKRGQVTVYIIIGLIALLSMSVFFYMRSAKIEAPLSYTPTIEQVPVEAQPIQLFVQSCVEQVAEDGLKKIGDYGGYISAEEFDTDAFEPTNGDAVQFSPGSGLIIPYWWHLSNSNKCHLTASCVFKSARPNLFRSQGGINIEEQLDEYVNQNLKTCLRGFADIQDFGFEISEAGPVETKTVVTRETVAFHVNYPLIAEKGSVSYQINEYFVDVPLKLSKIYELATYISNMEIEQNFIEYHIQNLISLYSDTDSRALPPFSDSAVTLKPGVTWIKNDVQRKLTNILISYVPMLQVMNTRNYKPIDFPEDTDYRNAMLSLYNNNMLIPVANGSNYPDFDVNFMYTDWWNPYIELNCDDQMCKAQEAEMMSDIISIGLKRYEFNYDVSIPVLVEIGQQESFRGTGYSFKFFLEGNLRRNDPLAIGLNKSVINVTPTPIGTMLCDDNKRVSEEITVKVTDGVSGLYVDDVNVIYSCGPESCKIGKTDSEGTLKAKFPLCIGGNVQFRKEGYLSKMTMLGTTASAPFEFSAVINPKMTIDVEVVKYRLVKNCYPILSNSQSEENEEQNTSITSVSRLGNILECHWDFENIPIPLSPKEEAIITLKRTTALGEKKFSTMAEYQGDRTIKDRSKNVEIVPGKYDIKIYTSSRAEMTIPEREECEYQDFEGIRYSKDCYTIDAFEFGPENPYPSGGAILDNIKITGSDIEQYDKITFYVFVGAVESLPESARLVEDITVTSGKNLISLSKEYENKIKPTFSKVEETQERQTIVVIT